MTSVTNTDSSEGREGRVFDLGYRRYDGPREGRNRARRAVYVDGLRIALGLGRGGRAKILPWLFIAVVVAIGLVMSLVVGVVNREIGEGVAEAADLPTLSDFYRITSLIIFLFAAVVGPELLCPDRHSGVINLYLVRPITSLDYVAARFLAFLSVMLLVVWLPQVVLFTGLVVSDNQPGDYFTKHWEEIPKFLAAGAALAVYTTGVGLAVAGFTTRRGYASVGLIGLLIMSQIAALVLGETITGTAGHWLALISLSDVPMHINELVFDTDDSLQSGRAARELSTGVRIGAYFVFTLVPIGILLSRYRRLTV